MEHLSTVHKNFLQFFTIHCVKIGHYIPLIFSLLLNKPSKTYELLHNIMLKKNALALALRLEFNPSIIISNFKQSINVDSKIQSHLASIY